MTFSNAEKSKHGRSAQDSLANILKRCMKAGYLAQVDAEYRIGKEGFSNSKQFYAPFLITFKDGTKWALFTTTSMRTDRIKGQQWDAVNLKDINHSIKHAYLVYPDSVTKDEQDKFLCQNEKYVQREEYSVIDEVVSQEQISNMIEAYAIRDKNAGQIKDIQGKTFESMVADIFSCQDNLAKWKHGDKTIVGMHYGIFQDMVKCFGLQPAVVAGISATADKKKIGLLPSGGNPKTDVLVTVKYADDREQYFTISCKRSSNKSVSVHQYDADAFADVLDKGNSRLRVLLQNFQACGNLRDFGAANQEALTKELAPYVEKLTFWALGGHGGSGNPQTQMAGYVLTYDNNNSFASIKSVEDYCKLLMLQKGGGHFGTPFSWTYPSKRKGKDIQLKCKIIKCES